MEDKVILTTEEYDALRVDNIMYGLLKSALFRKAKLCNYRNCGLEFEDVEDIMAILFPEECAAKVAKLRAEREKDDV